MTLNQKKKKSRYQSLLPDELLMLWGCWDSSHESVKYNLAYFVLLPPNLFVSIWSYTASILQLIRFGLLVRVVSLKLTSILLLVFRVIFIFRERIK